MGTAEAPLWTDTGDGERHIVSKCGLYCDTCPAFQNGLCNGCPRLGPDECVVRDCAHRKEIETCLDCELDSCYHFEAYAARRQLMRQRTRAYLAKEKTLGKQAAGAGGCGGCAAGGCASGGCGSGGCGSGGCGGCSLVAAAGDNRAGGCSALKILEALERAAG